MGRRSPKSSVVASDERSSRWEVITRYHHARADLELASGPRPSPQWYRRSALHHRRRLIVHQSIHDTYREDVSIYGRVPIGIPDDAVLMGPLISEQSRCTMMTALDAANNKRRGRPRGNRLPGQVSSSSRLW